MAQKVKQEKEPEPDEAEDEEPDEDGGEDDSGGSGTVPSGGDLAGYVRSIVKEVLGDGAPAAAPAGGRRSRVDDEDEIFHRVKSAQDKLRADEEREGRFRKVEETLEKVLERPPARAGFAGKLQRAIWGEE